MHGQLFCPSIWVVDAIERDHSRRQAAERFRGSASSAIRWRDRADEARRRSSQSGRLAGAARYLQMTLANFVGVYWFVAHPVEPVGLWPLLSTRGGRSFLDQLAFSEWITI